MNDWLKNRPALAWLMNLLSSVLVVFIAFWLAGWSGGRTDVSNDIEILKLEKADIVYVDKTCSEINQRIDKKADKSLVESMDSKLDLILQKLR